MPLPPQDPQTLISAIPELESEPDPSQFMQGGSSTLLVCAFIVLVLLVAAGVLWWIRRCKRNLPPPPTPLEIALAHLRELEQQLPPLRECGLRVSLIIRQFLQGTVQDPALYETHEEFSRRIDALVSVPEECRYDTRFLLEQLAELKYAGSQEQNPEQARRIVEQASALLRRIQEIQNAAAEKQAAATTPRA